MSIPSFSSRPIPSMFMHCQGLVNLWPWTAYCLITWFFSVCSWEERISHCLQLSLVSKLLSTYIAGHCPPSLCCVKVWWLSDYEQQRVQNIKRQQDLETSLKSSLNWIAVTLELHSFRCSDEEYIEDQHFQHFHNLYKIKCKIKKLKPQMNYTRRQVEVCFIA